MHLRNENHGSYQGEICPLREKQLPLQPREETRPVLLSPRIHSGNRIEGQVSREENTRGLLLRRTGGPDPYHRQRVRPPAFTEETE